MSVGHMIELNLTLMSVVFYKDTIRNSVRISHTFLNVLNECWIDSLPATQNTR